MRLTFLGTSAAVPTLRRNVSALALQFEQRREWWLFDCGEGTQQQLFKSDLPLAALERVFLSHLHGDHCFGLPGLLATRGMMGGTSPVTVHGPVGTAEYLLGIQRTTGTHCAFPLDIREHAPTAEGEEVADDGEYAAWAGRVLHGPFTMAFVITEHDRPGRFRVEEARALNVPEGPLFAQLKRGQTVTLADGRSIDGSTLVDPPRPGRKVTIVCDTYDASAVLPRAQNSDVVVHEATYAEADAAMARQNGHSTSADAGRFAQQARAKALLLSHFSARYDQRAEDGTCIADLVAQAQRVCPAAQVLAAKDFMQYEIPRPKR
jgi:ribonuclease Z